MRNEINYETFDWQTYLLLNTDITNSEDPIVNKKIAWEHWINHGIIEDRPTQILNNTQIHNGRLGNLFFINMAVHFISLKLNLKCIYKYKSKFEKIGISLFEGSRQFEEDNYIEYTDDNFMDIIHFFNEKKNIKITNNLWFQTEEFCELLKLYFRHDYHKHKIITNNLFKCRYNSNSDLFIHVRLGDLVNMNANMEDYFYNTIKSISFENGYISSDSIEHSFCKKLISTFSLNIINKNEEETIMFGSTCKYIVLSGGTFSWLIGFFAFFSKVIYFPIIKTPWYGPIFNNMNWKGI